MSSTVVQEAAAALGAAGGFQRLRCAWVAGEPQTAGGNNQPRGRNPALLWLAKCFKILDKPGQGALFLSHPMPRFLHLRQQAEQALCTLKCTSLENSTFSPAGLQLLMLAEAALCSRGAHALGRALAASEAAHKN